MNDDNSSIILFKSEDGAVRVNVRYANQTVWLTQSAMAELFSVAVQNITQHLKNIFSEGELNEQATCKDFLQVQQEGPRQVSRLLKHYNLDVIIAIGYRVNSIRATQFRIWATQILKSYIVKGFALDDERMKSGKSMGYFDELQERIREIRLSERVFYQKIKDIYATSIDYNPKAEKTLLFFRTVQNKLLWAISRQTAAELVVHRADASKPFMGMTSCDKKIERRLTSQDAMTAKNYLTPDEIKALGLLVEQYLAFAEAQAQRQVAMRMSDWVAKLDAILVLNGRELLRDAGKISHAIAEETSRFRFGQFRERLSLEEREASIDELDRDLREAEKRRKRGRRGNDDSDGEGK